MFALRNPEGEWAMGRNGRHTYTSRETARIAARILGRRDKTTYTVTEA